MGQRKWNRGRIERTAIAIAVASCLASPAAIANPTGPAVVNGTASIIQNGSLLQITNSPNAIINWQSFSIGANEITRFLQQSASSAVLNRVITQNPSAILGALQSNGRVLLINPNGIVFGSGAQVDVAGLVASTLNLSDADFLANRLRFTDTAGAGSVVNQGNITTGSGGSVYLVGPAVTNSGIITSPQGEVILAAGNSVELVEPGTPNLRVEFAAADNEARNLGQIIADAGRIGIYAGLVNQAGTIRADSAVMTADGRIVLKATKNTTLEAGSVTTANGPIGGSITIQSGETTLVSGTVKAKGLGFPPDGGGVAPTGDGVVGKGGAVRVLGNLVGLVGDASIDVSGETGGGTALVGGDFQGKNLEVQNAFRTYVGSDTIITADAVVSGDGGKVVVWSDDTTRFYGNISARGGATSGNGGFAEVSGKEFLVYRGVTDLTAPIGGFGTLLLDPRDITIQASGSNNLELSLDGQILFADPLPLGDTTDYTLSAATVSGSLANVVLQAQRDIDINAPIGIAAAGVSFTAQAGRDITVNQSLTTNGGKIRLEADSPHQPTGPDGVGIVTISAAVNSNGGKITLIGGGASNPQGGFKLDADVNAGAGGIDISLSEGGTLNFFIGAGGNTQLSSNDTGSLKTTGALVLGKAISGGPTGLGTPVTENPLTGAVTLLVNQLTNETASPIQLSPDSGTSFELHAGGGGILLDRPLTTYQDTVISTTGDLTINETLGTSGNDLKIDAANVILGLNGSINTGDGVLTCINNNCGALTTVFWDGGANTLNWFDALNWSNDLVPTNQKDVTIETTLGTIVISGGAAAAKSLIALKPVELSSGSLALANASNFSDAFTLSSGGSLQGTGGVTVSGPNGSLTWSGGTMASGGTFLLAGGRNGILSNSLTLDRLFQNDGSLTLSGATLSGTGSITNLGTLTASGTNIVSKMLLALGTVDGAGSLTVQDWTRTGGVFNMAGSADLRVPSGNFSVDQGYTAGNLMLKAASGDVILNAPVTGTGGSGTTVTLISGNNFTNNAGASAIDPGGGRFLVYSTNPADDTRGGLVYNFKQYDATFGVTTIQGTGNGFLYSVAPITTPTLAGTATKVYDGTTTATLAAANYATLGEIDGDAVVLNNPVSGAYADKNVGTAKNISASGIAISSVTDGTGARVFGYQLSSTTASGNIGEITPATLTYVANAASRERGDSNPIFGGSVTGFVGGETLVTVTAGALNFTSPATQSSIEGQYAIDGGGLTANNGNYVFAQAPANATALTITAPVTFLWTAGVGGTWETGSNWNKGFAPVDGAVVTIPDIGATGVSDTITYSIGTTNARTVTSAEALAVAGGTLNLGTNPADVSIFPQLTLAGGTLGGAGTVNVATLSILAGGVLGASGVINGNVSNTAGTVSPGASPGRLTINGNYVQGPGGVLAVEIGGTAAGTQYDQLIVTGSATLDGTLDVSLLNGLVPLDGDTFVVLTGGAVNGSFAAASFPITPPMSASYLASSVNVLTGMGAPLALLPVVDQGSQIVVATANQGVVAEVITVAIAEIVQERREEEMAEQRRKPICMGSSGSGGGGGGFAGAGMMSGGGGRCTTRGCF